MKSKNLSKICLGLVVIVFLIIGIKNRINSKNIIKETNEQNVSEVKESSKVADINKVESDEKDKKDVDHIYVHITGAIKKEGLYKLKADSRLSDLIEICGGLKDDADINKINLAMKLTDQMRLHIAKLGEKSIEIDESVKKDASQSKVSEKININTASLEELDSLPGIGKKRAQDIIELRNRKTIKSAEDLKEIHGLGDKLIEKIKELIEY